GQSEQLDDPPLDGRVQPGRDGRHDRERSVLVPRAREPRRRECRRVRPTRHETEVARPVRRDRRGRTELVQEAHGLGRVARTVGERLVESAQRRERLLGREDAAIWDYAQVLERRARGLEERSSLLAALPAAGGPVMVPLATLGL